MITYYVLSPLAMRTEYDAGTREIASAEWDTLPPESRCRLLALADDLGMILWRVMRTKGRPLPARIADWQYEPPPRPQYT